MSLYVLKRMPRIGWIIAGIPKCSVERVADHSYFVTLLAYIMSFFIKNVDREKLLKIALIHDLSEAIVHDIGGKARKLIPRDIRKKAELEGLMEIIPDSLTDLRNELAALWKEYERDHPRRLKLLRR
ncbi:hypothetical protein DRN63_05195 [Nanoarchaeota archaeon]|nr:MAG: hypothetical protein DRN63_05195 [Nanoarchaeota archaeon]